MRWVILAAWAVFGLALSTTGAGAASSLAPDPTQGAIWDLSPLFPTPAAWDLEADTVEAALPGLASLKDGLGASPAALRTALDRISDVRRRLQRLHAYAHLAADVDLRVAEAQARVQRVEALQSRFDETVAFVGPGVLALGRAKVEAYERADPGLARHQRPLELILRRQAHVLSPDAEKVLAAAEVLRDQPQAIHDTLAYADMPRPTIDVGGKPVRLTPHVYGDIMGQPDRDTRRRAFEASAVTYAAYQRTFGAVLAAYLQGWSFEAKARGYPSSLALSLADDNMSEVPYRTLVAETDKAPPAIHRYLRLRKRLLGVDELQVYDLYAPLAKGERTYSLAEGEDLILKALTPLGPDYVAKLSQGFASRVMHAEPGPGKSPAAYTNDEAYGAPPFVLLSFTGGIDSVSTVAHEWGHAMHSRFAEATQPFETAGYSPFVADAPSLTNEMLLADYMIGHAQTHDEKILALSQEIDLLRSAYFAPAMMAAFELRVHDAADHGEPLTGEHFAKIYCDLLRRFDGEAQGVMKVDDRACASWSNVQVYYGFYLYRYITATSAAAYFTEGVERGDTAARGRFFSLLKSGGSDDPYALLRRAGFDPATPEAYQPMVTRMERLVDALEAEVAKAPAATARGGEVG
jgi:oligoendopeptidase F